MLKPFFAFVCCAALLVNPASASSRKSLNHRPVSPGVEDDWFGGSGTWNTVSQWTAGIPGSNSDVNIYSGTTDSVTLDVGSTTVLSLALGGPLNGTTSTLTDAGTTQNLTVTNGLAIGVTGFLQFTGGGTLSAGNFIDSDFADFEKGSTLTVAGDSTNTGELFTDQGGLGGNNSLHLGGNLFNTGVVQLNGSADSMTVLGTITNQLDADVFLYGAGSMATLGALNNSGVVDVENGSTLRINGSTNNSGNLYTDQMGLGGSNHLTITGTLTNIGNFELNGHGDVATMASLTTSQFVDVENGSTLQVNGDVSISADFFTDNSGLGGNNSVNVTGNLDNAGLVQLFGTGDTVKIAGSVTNLLDAEILLNGSGASLSVGSLNNAGTVSLSNSNTLTVNGSLTNSGVLNTNSGSNTVTVSGGLTNTSTGQIALNGPGDALHVAGSMINAGTISVTNNSSADPPFFGNLGSLNIDGTSQFVVGTGASAQFGYVQLANGTLGEMISATNFGLVTVNGPAYLDGTLDILLQGGFNPSVGSTYDFLLFSPGELNGVFANVQNAIFNNGTEIWQVTYDNPGGFVELTAEARTTPEPASLLLLLSGVAATACKFRRRG
jgi:fibronectin-binding autotransporter adhesin